MFAGLDGSTHESVAKNVLHDIGQHVLLIQLTVELGADDDRVWRRDKAILRDRLANLTDRDLGSKSSPMTNHGFVVAIVNVDCGARYED